MKNWYFSTYTSGLTPFIEAQLKRDIDDVKISLSYDGLILYNTSLSFEQVREIPYFNNTLISIDHFPTEVFDPAVQLKTIREGEKIQKALRAFNFRKGSTFRVNVFHENEMISTRSIDDLHKIENTIAHFSKMTLDVKDPDFEMWLLCRREGHIFFGMKRMEDGPIMHQGELRSSLAHALVLMTSPTKSDIVVDPFCGYGSVVWARKEYSFRRMYCYESNQELYDRLKFLFGKYKKIDIYATDGTELVEIEENSVDAIIADPPWGKYQEEGWSADRLRTLYFGAIRRYVHVLKPGGRIVLLTAQKELAVKAFASVRELSIESTYDILVGGAKAKIFVAHKTRQLTSQSTS